MIRRLRVSRFRSLAKEVSVELGPLTVLVGQNGAGKSNTIDALVFLADCMQMGLEGAVTKRTGITAVRHAGSQGHPYDVTIGVDVGDEGFEASYEIVIASDSVDQYRVKRETATVARSGVASKFRVEQGEWAEGPSDVRPAVQPTSLALPLVAGDARFAPLAGALRSVAKYSIFPDVLRTPQKYDPTRPMDLHGANWVSILKDQPQESWKPDLLAVLHKLTGDIDDVKFDAVAGFLVMQFHHEQDPKAKRKQWFDAGQESDGTLRVAGMLTALLQLPRPALIALEEPELTVHPGAIRLLVDYIREAAGRTQVVLTTHSPDLLGQLTADEVRVVSRVGDATAVGRLDEDQRSAVSAGLFTLGGLMRSEGLRAAQLPLREAG